MTCMPVQGEAMPREEAHHRLLSCMSLNKLTGDYVEAHAEESTGRALKALVTHQFNAIEATEWTMDAVRPSTRHLACVFCSEQLGIHG